MDVIELIYLLRRAGYTQVSLARELGVTRSVVNGVIHGHRPSFRVASHIADTIGIGVNDLWPDRYHSGAAPRAAGQRRHNKEDLQKQK